MKKIEKIAAFELLRERMPDCLAQGEYAMCPTLSEMLACSEITKKQYEFISGIIEIEMKVLGKSNAEFLFPLCELAPRLAFIDEQIELLKKENRGGARTGAGRPKEVSTKTMSFRVNAGHVAYLKPAINALINAHIAGFGSAKIEGKTNITILKIK